MNFSTADKVLQTIRAGDDVEGTRSANRSKINDAANFVPPLTEKDAQDIGLKINVNWGELAMLLASARRQFRTAHRSDLHFFKVQIPLAPLEYRQEWELYITDQINRYMRKSEKFFELQESRWAATVCHGISPVTWYKPDPWCADTVSINDLRVPTDTTLDLENCHWWAIRQAYTPYSLSSEVFGEKASPGWNKKAIAKILKNYKELNFTDAQNNYDWETSPEKIHGLMKQNGGYYGGDAMPTIPLWHFYFQDDSQPDKTGIFMRVVPERHTIKEIGTDDFLWTSDEPVAEKRCYLLHLNYGDLNNDSPFKYYAVRSLGFALLEPCFYTNLTRCKLLQHVFDNFNIWLKTTDPADRARAAVQMFSNLAVLRPGLGVVPQAERHQVDGNLVQFALAQLKQLQQEASSSYTQQTDTGTSKEQTAFEVSVKVQQVNAMTSGLLMKSFIYEGFHYNEICRRFCRENSKDPDVQEFQKNCDKQKIPRAWLDTSKWDVEPVTPIGSGNPTVALSMANMLREFLPEIEDQTAKQEIKHDILAVMTQDARKAARWGKVGRRQSVTNGGRDAAAIFGTLMDGVAVPYNPEFPLVDQIEGMIPVFAGKIVAMTQRDNMATPEEAIGLQTVGAYIGQMIGQLSQNPKEKERVTKYGQDLGKLMNEAKGLIQRGAEAQKKMAEQAQQQESQAEMMQAQIEAQISQRMAQVDEQVKVRMAKLDEELAVRRSQLDAEITTRRAQLDEQIKAAEFEADQRRKNADAQAKIERDNELAAAKAKNIAKTAAKKPATAK